MFQKIIQIRRWLYHWDVAIIEANPTIFASRSDVEEHIIYKMEDDYGTSYYYRGAKDYLNNNLIFAEHQWKIVRINGDGSIRIIFNGTCPNNTCNINVTGNNTRISTSAFNTSINDNKYVGYMYGIAEVPTTLYETAHLNKVNSTVKTTLDNWYASTILNSDYVNLVVDNIFCNDRSLFSGSGSGTSMSNYMPTYRLDSNKNPSIKCTRQEDRFTVNDTVIGNGKLTYPVGLLSADEAAIAGLRDGTGNTSNYLRTGQLWLLNSPYNYIFISATSFNVKENGSIGSNATLNAWGVRPVINLKKDVLVMGTGSTEDPFVVSL